MAACPELPREPVTVQPWTMSLHLLTVAARLAVVDPEVRPLEGEPGFWPSQRMEVRLPRPVTGSLLEGHCFICGDGAEVWTAVHRQLLARGMRPCGPPRCDRLVGAEWRLWAANGPCPPVVVWPRRSGPGPSWESIVLLWGRVMSRGVGGHTFTALQGMAMDTDGKMALQLTAEPLTTHVNVVSPQWGAERPQPWWDPFARVPWRDPPPLQSTIWQGGRKAAPGGASIAPGLHGRLPAPG